MARNQEKAQSMLHRFRQVQAAEAGVFRIGDRRPPRASDCNSIYEAEQWRQHFIQQASRKVVQIQNVNIPDHQIRELNDEINRLMRVKYAWEIRIRELGGPDYTRSGSRMLSADGKEVPGARGYRYYGRAKELPGVRELFEQQTIEPVKQTAGELYRRVDAEYYGYHDEEDESLLAYEAQREEELLEELKQQAAEAEDTDVTMATESTDKTSSAAVVAATVIATELINGKEGFRAYVSIPSQQDVEDFLVRRRKQELADKYAGGQMDTS